MKVCSACGQRVADEARFCTRCGRYVYGERIVPDAPPEEKPMPESPSGRSAEQMALPPLYVMIALLALALLFPPWEAPGDPPRFLGFHAFSSPPEPGALISRLLITVELTTIAIAGFYVSWLFRKKR
jgi:hypothetical protein